MRYGVPVRQMRLKARASYFPIPHHFLSDWSYVADVENFVASHLLKSIHYCTHTGRGEYEVYFLHTKDKKGRFCGN